MAKKNGTVLSAETTKIVEGRSQNGETEIRVTQVRVTAMSSADKGRIEKLVDQRRDKLTTYLGELRGFSTEANKHMAYSGESRLDKLKDDLSRFDLTDEQFKIAEANELDQVVQVLKQEHQLKLDRLDAMKEKIRNAHQDAIGAATIMVQGKYAKKRAAAQTAASELRGELVHLERAKAGEALVRQIALKNSFDKLEAEVDDQRNRAVEKLWTEVVVPEDAKAVLDTIPDSTKFRQQVTPDHLFGLFNETLRLTSGEEAKSALCAKCQSSDIVISGSANYYCRKCSHRGKFDSSISNLSGLPTLEDIMNAEGPARLVYHAPKPELAS